MAIYSCKKHGSTGVKMICSHASKGIDTGVPLKTTVIETDDLLLPKIRLCNACVTSWHGLGDEVEKEKFLESLVPVCGKCFDENGLPTHD
jgi:hypothetical protein